MSCATVATLPQEPPWHGTEIGSSNLTSTVEHRSRSSKFYFYFLINHCEKNMLRSSLNGRICYTSGTVIPIRVFLKYFVDAMRKCTTIFAILSKIVYMCAYSTFQIIPRLIRENS